MSPRYLRSNGEPVEVQVEPRGDGRVRVVVGEWEREVHVADLGHGRFRLGAEGDAKVVTFDRDGAARFVTVGGVGEAKLEREERGRSRRRESSEGILASPMPGTVVKVLVAAGDAVAKGDDLVIVEAMKMEIKISAPRDGRVKSVAAAEGRPCDGGEILVELEAGAAE